MCTSAIICFHVETEEVKHGVIVKNNTCMNTIWQYAHFTVFLLVTFNPCCNEYQINPKNLNERNALWEAEAIFADFVQ